MNLEFKKIQDDNYPYPLLLLADETKDAINKYLFESEVFEAIINDEVVGVFCLYKIDNNVVELKNIAVKEELQSKGLGRLMVNFIIEYTKKTYKTLIVGTADAGDRQIKFYEQNGFIKYGIRENFYIDHYPEPIIENGRIIKDMIMLKLNLNEI